MHRPKGFDTTKGGYEYNLALMAIAAGLLLAGPGRLSIHHAVAHALVPRRRFSFSKRPRRRWGVLRVLAALLG